MNDRTKNAFTAAACAAIIWFIIAQVTGISGGAVVGWAALVFVVVMAIAYVVAGSLGKGRSRG